MAEHSYQQGLGLAKLQAVIRGRRSREVHCKRAQLGAKIVCPFVSANESIVFKIIENALIEKSDIVLDIGSGDGGIIVPISQHTGARTIGVEIDELLCRTARRKAREAGVSNLVDVINMDALNTMIGIASVVSLFLVPSCLQILSPKLREGAKKGLKIVNIKYPLPSEHGWIPSAVVLCEDVVKLGSSTFIYIYEVQ